jgi:serine/threonine-protein kinase HipA
MVSALTLLGAEDSHRSRHLWSYPILLEELRRALAGPREAAVELFRRMTFNALISNGDDHPRNHAPIAWEDWGRWANATNLLGHAPRFLLEATQAGRILDELEGAVTTSWHSTARGVRVSERECALIKDAFAYPGFRLDPR